jgi:hypothetical protein
MLIKNNEHFHFDKVIFADMFLSKNKAKTDKIRELIKNQKIEISLIQENMKNYKEFTSSISLLQTLKSC